MPIFDDKIMKNLIIYTKTKTSILFLIKKNKYTKIRFKKSDKIAG